MSQSNLASASPPPSASSAGGGVGRGGLLSRKKVRLLAGGSTLGTSDDAKENSSSGAILDLQISATNAITRRLPWLFLADPYTQQPVNGHYDFSYIIINILISIFRSAMCWMSLFCSWVLAVRSSPWEGWVNCGFYIYCVLID